MIGKKASVLFVLISVFRFSTVFSQTIDGTVKDHDSDPVINAFVEFIDESDTLKRYSDFTDSSGYYHLVLPTDNVNEENPVASTFDLFQNYPNPFNPSTVIHFNIQKASQVRLCIYDILGRQIKTLLNQFHDAGTETVIWDATDDFGRGVPAGVYFYTLFLNNHRVAAKKMVLMDGNFSASTSIRQTTFSKTNLSKSLKTESGTLYQARVTGDNIEPFELYQINIVRDTTIHFIVNREIVTEPMLDISPTALDFGDSLTVLTFVVQNSGTGTLNWSVSDDQDWIGVDPASGTNSDTVTVTVNRSLLEPGNYQSTITINSNGGNETVDVSVNVPENPILSIAQNVLDFGSTLTSLNFNVINSGTGSLIWSVSESYNWIDVDTSDGVNSGSVRVTVDRTKLSFGNYEGAIFVNSNGGKDTLTVYCQYADSTTGTVTDVDGNVYHTIKIGNQWWTLENLKVTHYSNGHPIPNIIDYTQWSSLLSGAYSDYKDNTNNSETYGKLYNWHAVHDSRGIAPEGWRVPTDYDWKELEMYLGMSQSEADQEGYRGADEGGKLKETGIVHWATPNTGATNVSGFTALPGGYRKNDGSFTYLGAGAFFWTATGFGVNDPAWYRFVDFANSGIYRYLNTKTYGYSVRCVRPTMISLQLNPPDIAIAPGETCQFACWATYSDQSTVNVTHLVTWSVSPGGAGSIDENGFFTAHATDMGVETVTAIYQGQAGCATLTVTDDENRPILQLDQTVLDFGSTLTSLALQVSNGGKGNLTWSVTDDQDWMAKTPKTGTNPGTVTVTVNRKGLSEGDYNGTLTVISNGGVTTINVRMTVPPSPDKPPVACWEEKDCFLEPSSGLTFCTYDASCSYDFEDSFDQLMFRWIYWQGYEWDVDGDGISEFLWSPYYGGWSNCYTDLFTHGKDDKELTLEVKDTNGHVSSIGFSP